MSLDASRVVQACIRLKGDMRGAGAEDDYDCENAICAHCWEPIGQLAGQDALAAVAAAEGIYFRARVPCKCGCSVGLVKVERCVQS